MKKTRFLGSTGVAILCATVLVVAQDAKEASAPSAETLVNMAPGPMHAMLEPLVGNWKTAGKWRMTADAPWEEFEATVERTWILGKRFVQETVESEFMGEPFEGMGLIGYDNIREEFTMVWVENTSTGTWFNTGQMEGSTLVFEGENSDAMTGEKSRWNKSVCDMTGDQQTFKGYARDDSGKEFQTMEMVSTRQ